MDRYAHCLFCDEIRQEINQKLLFLGVYSNDLIVPGDVPVNLPKLAIVVWVVTSRNDPFDQITIRVTRPGQEDAEFEVPTPPGELPDPPSFNDGSGPAAKTIVANAFLEFSPFEFSQEGEITVHVETGRETLVAGSLRLRTSPPKDMVR
ncbi:MAG: hypothetical protein ACE5EM_07725 [Sphingomonadales bacterium]